MEMRFTYFPGDERDDAGDGGVRDIPRVHIQKSSRSERQLHVSSIEATVAEETRVLVAHLHEGYQSPDPYLVERSSGIHHNLTRNNFSIATLPEEMLGF